MGTAFPPAVQAEIQFQISLLSLVSQGQQPPQAGELEKLLEQPSLR